MGMRATERSLRWCFWVAGAIAIVYSSANISDSWNFTRNHPTWRFPLVALLLARTAFGGAFLVAGYKLKEALVSDATWIRGLVILAGVGQLVELALVALSDLRPVMIWPATLICGVGVTFTIYLHYNLMRLSREAKARLPAVFE